MNEILTIQEVAELLKMHPVTVTEKCRTGELPAVKIGGKWRFSREKIMALFETATMNRENHKG